MNATASYTGFLVGGPSAGNLITCISNKIPVIDRTELDLDGDVKLQIVKGHYIWDEISRSFIWNIETVNFPDDDSSW